MFEKEIKFIGDFCFNQVKSLGNVFTLDKIIAAGIHPAIIQYTSAELDFMIYSDRRKLLQQSYFDYTGREISDHFQRISNEIKKNKKISLEDSKKLIFQAVSFNINYLVRPRWSLTKLIFNDQPVISTEEMKMMLNYLYYYDYYKKVISAYLSKRNLLQISSSELDILLSKIDNELLSSNQEQLVENSFLSIGDFFNIGGVDKNIISLMAVEIFFKEKNLMDLLLKLRKNISNGVKKQYNKNELERLLFAPDQEAEPDEEKKEDTEAEPAGVNKEIVETEVESEPEENEINSDEGFEKTNIESFLTPEEEQSLLSLYDEEQKASEISEESEFEASKKETYEHETLEQEIVSSLADETSEQDFATDNDIKEIVDSMNEELQKEESQVEEIPAERISVTTETTSEELLDEEIKSDEITSAEVTAERVKTEAEDQIDDPESESLKSGYEKEIVQEMIKDFYGEGETDYTILDEVEQESDEINETIPEEDLKSKIETLEDELLNIFEDLDKEEFPTSKEKKPLEESERTFTSEEEENLKKQKTFLTGQTEGIDDYLKSMDEAVFSNKKEKIKDERMMNNVNEVINEPENIVEPDNSNTLQSTAFEKQAVNPREIRPKDLFSYLRRKDIKKIVSLIFVNDEEDFVNTAERIMDCHSYREASEILKAVFTSYKISPYSKEALTFTNSVSNYFRQA